MVQSRPATFQLVTDTQDFVSPAVVDRCHEQQTVYRAREIFQRIHGERRRLSHARKTVVVIVLFVLSGHFLHLVCVTPLCMVPSGVKIYSHRQAVKLWAL